MMNVGGEAYWPGPDPDPDLPPRHSGEIDGKLTLLGNRARYGIAYARNWGGFRPATMRLRQNGASRASWAESRLSSHWGRAMVAT